MSHFLRKHHRALFYSGWIILGLIQSRFTQLLDDEAYYWMYARYLDWGYFDHPPMIAVMIKAGYAIFPNELGVRLFPFLFTTLSVFIIEKLIRPANYPLFYGIVLSIAALQLGGFIAVPDTPLIFFTAVFFWCYKRFLEDRSWQNAVLLGVVMALLMYSKYHGILIILFTILSSLKLLRTYHIYLAGLTAIALYIPHIWWQYEHGWVSVKFHVIERYSSAYQPAFTLEYLIGQILLAGPLAGFLLVPAAIKYRPHDNLQKALKYCLVGFYIFFLLSTFKGRVEANWTAPLLIPLVVLSYFFLAEKVSWRKWLFRIVPVTLLLVLCVRILMIADITGIGGIKERFHAWRDWPQVLKERTHGLPVVFTNSHQRAAKLEFYTGQQTHSLNDYRFRRNNYDFWPVEDSLLGKPVYFADIYDMWKFTDSIPTPIGWLGYRYDSMFLSFTKIRINVPAGKIVTSPGQKISLHIHVDIPAYYEQFIRTHLILTDTVRVGIFKGAEWKKELFTDLSLRSMTDQKEIDLVLDPGLEPGKYSLAFAINCGRNFPTHNSERIPLLIK